MVTCAFCSLTFCTICEFPQQHWFHFLQIASFNCQLMNILQTKDKLYRPPFFLLIILLGPPLIWIILVIVSLSVMCQRFAIRSLSDGLTILEMAKVAINTTFLLVLSALIIIGLGKYLSANLYIFRRLLPSDGGDHLPVIDSCHWQNATAIVHH